MPLCSLVYLALGGSCAYETSGALTFLLPLFNALALCSLILLAEARCVEVPVITPILAFAGKFSYSDYLLHAIVLAIITHFDLFSFQAFSAAPNSIFLVQPLYTGTVAAITFAFSWLFWITFEQRFLAMKVQFED